MDTRSPQQRRRIMQSVGTRDTGPEMAVRRLLFRAGFRFRVGVKSLPGTPDIVLSARRKILFVHGCFWHGHGCAKGKPPRSRPEYWLPKIAGNRERDAKNVLKLNQLGWDVMVVWQCEVSDPDGLLQRLTDFVCEPCSSQKNDRLSGRNDLAS
ncbi:very short patch repair endonuclease [Mesorhizobium sp. WSM1497]|nr:very short patch repair endonuclease [Mesorhizobium sp. WSM1497]ARP67542.1 very short patch repair endonuclease [Mesorhizobium sp. WSM1497]